MRATNIRVNDHEGVTLMSKAPSTTQATRYPGVFTRTSENGDTTFYIRYRRGGRSAPEIKEPVGKVSTGMTAAKANHIRASRIKGASSNTERRREELAAIEAENSRWTLKKLWDAYQEVHPEHKGNRPTDISNFKNHLSRTFGNRTVDEVTTMDIDRLRNRLLKQKAPATVRAVIELMRRLFNFGEKQGWYVIPKTLRFNMPKVDNQKTEVLTDEELSRLLTVLDGYEKPDIASYIKFVMHTGIRRSAAIAIRWSDCDFDRGFITLRGASAKSGKTSRIPMTPTVKDIILSLPRRYGGFLFPQLDPNTYTGHARKIADRAGLPPDFRPLHGMRHNFASRIASSGKVDLYTLQNLLTHASPLMTQRYAHLADESMRRAAMVADDVLTPKSA